MASRRCDFRAALYNVPMIGHISGKVIDKDERSVVIDVGGIGYVTFVSPNFLHGAVEGGAVSLWTHLAVREDALDLYGFAEKRERELFRQLIGISGIGPRSAMNVLSLADIGVIVRAIASQDSGYLTKVSGIGKKLAEKIVLELRDKVIVVEEEPVENEETEAILALEALGYAPKETREVVRAFARDSKSPQEIIRKALQTLGSHNIQ